MSNVLYLVKAYVLLISERVRTCNLSIPGLGSVLIKNPLFFSLVTFYFHLRHFINKIS